MALNPIVPNRIPSSSSNGAGQGSKHPSNGSDQESFETAVDNRHTLSRTNKLELAQRAKNLAVIKFGDHDSHKAEDIFRTLFVDGQEFTLRELAIA